MTSKPTGGLKSDFPKTDELLERLHQWANPMLADPEFRAFNRDKLRRAIDFRDEEPRGDSKDFAVLIYLEAVAAFTINSPAFQTPPSPRA